MKAKIIMAFLSTFLLGSISVAGIYVYSVWRQAEVYQRAYDATQVGDAKESVLGNFGPPTKIYLCEKKEDKNYSPCSQKVEYLSPFERWIVAFDDDDKVVYKNYGVSF